MPSYTWNATTLGQNVDWNTPGDWLPTVVPNAANADVLIPEITDASGNPYDFLVTIGAAESFVVNTLTLVDQSLVVNGSLSIGANLVLENGGTLQMGGSLVLGGLVTGGTGDVVMGSGRIGSTGSIDNQGLIESSGGVAPTSLTLDVGALRNDGTLAVLGSSNSLRLLVGSAAGAFDNVGTISTGGSLDVVTGAAAGGFANLVDGTLSLGRYAVGFGGLMNLDVGGDITTDAATIVLGGVYPFAAAAPALQTATGGTVAAITQTLATIAPAGALVLQNTGFADAVALTVAGVLQLEAKNPNLGYTLSAPALGVAVGGTIAGVGTLVGTMTNDGTILAQGTYDSTGVGSAVGGTLVLTGAVAGAGTLAIAPAVVGTYYTQTYAGNVLEVTGADSNTIVFQDWNGVLVLDNPSQFTGVIAGSSIGANVSYVPEVGAETHEASDTIILHGIPTGTITNLLYVGTSTAGRLSFDDAGNQVSLNFVGDYQTSDFVVSAIPPVLSTSPTMGATISLALPCFLAGTRLRTERGEVPVEQLAVGDGVWAVLADQFMPVRWLGHCRVDASRQPEPARIWPIRVQAGAFGMGRPHRDLYLSPDHSIHFDGVLIPVRLLVNGLTVAQTRLSPVRYFHVELPRHDIVLAEGLPAESYLDLGNRDAFANGGWSVAVHPDFGRVTWEREGCAELILGGPVLMRARARLHVQARLLRAQERRSA